MPWTLPICQRVGQKYLTETPFLKISHEYNFVKQLKKYYNQTGFKKKKYIVKKQFVAFGHHPPFSLENVQTEAEQKSKKF